MGEVRAKEKGVLQEHHLALLDYDGLFFELEQFKRERSWYNFNMSKEGIRAILRDSRWYTLYIPPQRLEPMGYDNVRLWQQIAAELLKRYCDSYYSYRKSEFIEPRLELRELTRDDDNLPDIDSQYQLIVDGSEEQLIQGINQIKKELEDRKHDFLRVGDLHACRFDNHVYEPLFHIRKGGKVTVLPVALNESEYQFVQDLKKYFDENTADFADDGKELFLLRNMARGRGVGFFEAGNFYPDFIMWLIDDTKQYITFVEPHGLRHEGPASKKIQFHVKIKEVEQRLGDPDVILSCFVLSWTKHAELQWGLDRQQMEQQHVLFMTEDREHYISKMFHRLT